MPGIDEISDGMTTAPWILGISASHDGAACLLHGHDLVVAIKEERVARVRRKRASPVKMSASKRWVETVQKASRSKSAGRSNVSSPTARARMFDTR